MENKGRKTGIMGGTFNPIHNGHLLMAQTAIDEFGLDEIIFIPTGLQWMKKGNPDVLDGEIRLEITRLATASNPAFFVSDIEVKRAGDTYTYETLEQLKEQEPDRELYFIIGADTLVNIPKWKYPERVLSAAVILCALRMDTQNDELFCLANELKEEYGADIRFMNMPLLEISSTDIRKRIKEGRSARYLLPDGVYEHILENGYYTNV